MFRPTALLLAVAAGCASVSASSLVDDAEVAVSRAHAAEGEKYARYETTLADLYLVKAKEEQGHARYSDAKELAADAVKFADEATRKAAERRASGIAPPMPTANVQHPAAPEKPKPADPAPKPPPTPPPPREEKKPIDPGEQK